MADLREDGAPLLTALGSVGRGAATVRHSVVCGENLHALELLARTHAGAVDCIYIDPPYNTGARDWRYNNDYGERGYGWRHSRWLGFMEARLALAGELLAPDGVLVVTIDHNEHAHLVCLLEELFRGHEVTAVAVVHNPRGIQGDNFSYTHEYALFVVPRGGGRRIAARPLDQPELSPLRNWGGESLREDARNCFYPIIVDPQTMQVTGFGDVLADGAHPAAVNEPAGGGDAIAVWPIDRNGVERKWRYARQSVERIRDRLVAVRRPRSDWIDVAIVKDEGAYRTVWHGPRFDASTHGTQLLRAFVDAPFPFPKSLYAVYEALHACVAERPDALVLDFFAGSGTTLHATCLLNADLGGRRRCILVTNNEQDIFDAVTRPRCEAAITGRRADGTPVAGVYETGERRARAAGFDAACDFYRVDYGGGVVSGAAAASPAAASTPITLHTSSPTDPVEL